MSEIISARTGVSAKDTKAVIDELCKYITDNLVWGHSVNLKNVGKFVIKTRKGRTVTNNFGSFTTPNSLWITFRSSLALRKKLNNRK